MSAVELPTPIKALLASAFFMNMCSFMVMPLLTVYLQHTLKLGSWQVASVLSTHVICARLLPIVGGGVADQTSYAGSLLTGVLVRGLGFAGFAVSSSLPWLIACAALVGLGGAMYDPSVSSLFALQPESTRRRAFTYFNQALNAGALAGPLLGSALVLLGARKPFVAAFAGLVALGLLLFRHRAAYSTPRSTTSYARSLRVVLRNRRFCGFVALMALFFMMFSQLYVSLPLVIFRLTGSAWLVSMIFCLNGLVGLVAMFGLRRWMDVVQPLRLIRAGSIMMALGLAAVPVLGAFAWVFACVILFSVGETLVLPAAEMAVAESAEDGAKGTYFGAFELAMAAGGTLGNYLGTFLMTDASNHYLPWLLYGSCGAVLASALSLVEGRAPAKQI